jgi:hypothetical protein
VYGEGNGERRDDRRRRRVINEKKKGMKVHTSTFLSP